MTLRILMASAVISASSLAAPAAFADHVPYNIVFIMNHHVLRGQNYHSAAGGVFSVTDGRLSCSSDAYNWWRDNDLPLRVPFACSDGRTGVTTSDAPARPNGDITYSSGRGTFVLSDGARGAFYWGTPARASMR